MNNAKYRIRKTKANITGKILAYIVSNILLRGKKRILKGFISILSSYLPGLFNSIAGRYIRSRRKKFLSRCSKRRRSPPNRAIARKRASDISYKIYAQYSIVLLLMILRVIGLAYYYYAEAQRQKGVRT